MIATICNERQSTTNFQEPQWSYEGDFGPHKWSQIYPLALGGHQSPIDIQSHNSVYNKNLNADPLHVYYDDLCLCHLKNTGSSFQVTSAVDKSEVTGGPTRNQYKFLQFHMHWGSQFEGSEHTVDGKQYTAEIHFVNVNTKFHDFNAALESHENDALMVLGVFVELGDANEEFEKIISGLEDVKLKNQTTTLKDNIKIKNLFPANLNNYWTYDGSLTTPPCNESVKWVLFQDPIQISSDQLEILRDLHQCTEESECCNFNKIKCNYRPTCALNERIVCKSFEQ